MEITLVVGLLLAVVLFAGRRRRAGFWVWIVGAVLAFFAVAALLRGGLVADNAGVGLAGVILFGALMLVAWKASNNLGFIGTTIGGLIVAPVDGGVTVAVTATKAGEDVLDAVKHYIL